VFGRRFLLDKVGNLVSLQNFPIHAAGPNPRGQETPGHAHIVMTGAGGAPADLIQILRISKEPLVSFRTRGLLALAWQSVFLTPEVEEMREPLGSFGQLT
jgi:hypothetical protein